MKLDAIIIKDNASDTYTGFIKDYPGVCAQASNIDDLKAKLDKYMKIWFDYASKNLSIASDEVLSF